MPARVVLPSAVAALAVVAACSGDSSSPSQNAQVADQDLAVLAVQAAALDVETMGGPPGPAGFGLFGVAVAGPFGPAAARDLGCRSITLPRVTLTRECTFTDAGGAAQTAYHPLETATARILTEMSGEWSHDAWSATMTRTSDVTVSGLAGQETRRTWNGTGGETIARSRHTEGEGTRSYTLTTSFLIDAVVVPVPGGPEAWPLSGSISRTLEGEITGGPRDGESLARTTVITFNGTPLVSVSVNGTVFEVDLRNRRVEPRRGR